ncbi:non-ribosomal peptide synthetase [Variovorax sp. PAMC 28711]|uniref:non-ribosomal peptide synthetase n=1 Tax=Variovorax sp. PAMC 28711 TaxID=1795631 RepID=UPI00078DDAEA|nr:non-ribosomal peptide synthetase [Variovorax sp. PAMC 28711]AMM24059.1 non-ribosomal peptide synthetase [Variovorax sp. PAMC 28711]
MSPINVKEPSDSDLDFDPFAAGAIELTVPSTEAQREVWLADQLGPQASLSYNESLTLRLHGDLDTAALAAAFDALVLRHPALRSTFSADGTQLLIGEPVPLQLMERDLRPLDAKAQKRALAAEEAASVREPFALEVGPLFRAALYQLSPVEFHLLMTAHHAICDGWSWGVVADDLGQLYAEQIGAGPALDAAPSYADYVAWEQQEANGATMQAHVDYWLSRFSGSSLPVLELPLDRARPTVRTFSSARIDHVLDRSLVDALRKTGAAQGASLYAALFSGFAAMLHRLTAQDDLVIGIAAAGQMASNMPALVGHCVNLLPLRVAVDAALPFDALLRQSAVLLLDAFEHQNLTYGTLLRKLPVTRDPSRLSLVSVMFNVDRDAAPNQGSFPDIEAVLGSVPRACENFELFVNIVPVALGMQVEVQYNTDLFDAVTISRWLKVYEQLLRSAVASPVQAVGQLAVMPPDEQAALRALQPAATPLLGAPLMHAAFCAQAIDSPSNAAIRYAGSGLCYGELDARSNRLARALRERGVGRGQRVGLCLPRDNDMVVALLAVLKSGAAYVPLDPDFPQARLDYYAQDAALALLLTRSDVAAAPRRWRDDAAVRVFELDAETSWLQASGEALAPGPLDPLADDPAYVIYTSGSTGKPKGVVVPHRPVANFLQSMQRQPGIAASDKLVAVTTLSFDIAVLELLLPLTVGAEVIIAPREATLNGGDLATLISLTGATLMQGTPGLWRLLLDSGWKGQAKFKVLVGGESLPPDLAHDLLRVAGEVWNMYGPTETTIWSTRWRVEPTLIGSAGISIGQPIDNTTVWILDAHLQQMPVGVPGEICIGGAGVTLGYLDRPELTADRFVTIDVDGAPSRLYRTGDRGRWRNHGLLEHMGRLDSQVKVRGYRIELGEIEARCNEAPGVTRSVVITREDVPGDVRLVAYLMLAPGASLDLDAVKRQLATSLPQYMLPQHFVPLEAIPLLPNGKVDRKALPKPEALAASGLARVAARTERERIVLETMEKVLRLPSLGIHDDFFALGGHSLLAARLATLLSRKFDVPVPMRVLFEAPTAEALALAIDAIENAGAPRRQPIVALPNRRSAPQTPMQQRIRFIEELHPGRSVYNQPATHRFAGPMDTARFEQAFREIVRRQSALRTTMGNDPATGEPCQIIHPSVDFPFPLIDLSGVPASEREIELATSLRQAIDRPIDIHRAPLFHAALYRMSPTDHAFVFVAHHLIWDGWSYDLFQTELAALYGALVRGETPVLPELSVGTGDYAQWYQEWLAGPEAGEQLKYWKARFANTPVPRAPRTDLPRKSGMSGHGETLWMNFDKATTERFRTAATQHDVTLNMFALGAYVLMLGSAIDTDSLVIAAPVRGREQLELESVMGFFNNVLPLSFEIDRSIDAGQFMRYVKKTLLDHMSYQLIPFERLVAEPEFAARAQGVGLYQGLFSFEDARGRPTDFGGLKHQQIHTRQSGATDDIGLWFVEKTEGLVGAVTYNSDIYLPETGAAFKQRYVELLNALVAAPDHPLNVLLAPDDSSSARVLARLAARSDSEHDEEVVAAAVAREARPMALLPPEQARLAQVWASALNIDVNDIRPTDNFFDLGGDSLLAMRVMQQAEQAVGFRVEAARYVFESLGQLAMAPAATPVHATADTATQSGGESRTPSALVRMLTRFGRKN